MKVKDTVCGSQAEEVSQRSQQLARVQNLDGM